MSTYFERNRQRLQQWRAQRRERTAPQVTLHTYEAPAGRTAAAGAKFLTERTNHGSYHWLSDAHGNSIHLAPWSSVTYHSIPNNEWSVGLSMMAEAAAWGRISATQRRHLINGLALGAHKFSRWCVSQGIGAVPARRINRAQAMRREGGFVTHGDMDPGRRTDPGAGFPWDEFFTEYRRLEGGGSTNTGGFLMSLSSNEQKALLNDVRDIKSTLSSRNGPKQNQDGQALRWLRETTENVRTIVRTLSPGGQVRTMIEAGGGNLDNDAIAKAIADSIPDNLAVQVVDELGKRVTR